MAEELKIQFSTSTAFASTVIRRLTHSRFSHCDIILPGEGLLGVSGPDRTCHDPGGVRIRPFNPWPYKEPPIVAAIQTTHEAARKAIEYGRSQIGKPFDNGALYAFLRERAGLPIVHRDWRDPSKWYCTEFGCQCLVIGGVFQYTLAISKDCISPQDLLLIINPLLTEENIHEFV